MSTLTLAEQIIAHLNAACSGRGRQGELEGGYDDSWWDIAPEPRIPACRQARLSRSRRSTCETVSL